MSFFPTAAFLPDLLLRTSFLSEHCQNLKEQLRTPSPPASITPPLFLQFPVVLRGGCWRLRRPHWSPPLLKSQIHKPETLIGSQNRETIKREHQESGGGVGGYPAAEMMLSGKGKVRGMEEEQDGGVDELLAALGYKVRSSDMADVALKLEQLEMAMGSSTAQDDAFLSHLAYDTVHYNPSDLSTWLESMLSELNTPPPPLPSPPPRFPTTRVTNSICRLALPLPPRP